ncbi:ABC transporter permease [Streptomyces sp. NBC_01283]|uniref:ABC transporter permease n=1 Tax=Streptomyces sp. NBC_01283 TaxID=2903812 RepID=UPI00352E16D2|nr:ABC transporter permease [Streptomyces sp. NBC_01283]
MSSPLLRGPRWADVRVHRSALRTGLGLVVLAAALTGLLRWANHAYPEPTGPCTSDGSCETFLGFSSARTLLYEFLKDYSLGMLLIPVLIGAFVAGPVIAREMESGTHKLAWTQSVSPARWLMSKLTVFAVTSVAGGLALMAVFWAGRSGIGAVWNLSWADRGVYESIGPVLVAYCLFAVMVGALAGLLVRRTLVALAAGGLVTGLVLLVMGNVRWQLFPVKTLSGPASGTSTSYTMHDVPVDSLIIDMGVHNAAGERFVAGQCSPDQMAHFPCPSDTKVTGWYADVHPHSHFWYVQFIETGIILVLATAAAYAAFRVLRRRAA